MATLCNACGINYRRARSKANGRLDLDGLARSMGTKRLSIQKSLKRQRKLELSIQSSRIASKFVVDQRQRSVTTMLLRKAPILPPIQAILQISQLQELPSVHTLL